MNIKIKILFLLIAVASISCEDYLREEPPTFISASNYWQTAGDARTGVDAVYKPMLNVHSRWWPIIDLYTDDMVTRSQGNATTNAFGTHSVTPSDRLFEQFGVYDEWWIGIGRANNVLKFVPEINMDETEKNMVLGEARALRAYFYYQLVRAFGDQPLLLDATITDADYNKPRSSVEVIYDQIIIPDLQFAEEWCRDALHDGHITKWTAKLLLSEVYLTRAGYRRTSQGEFIQGDAANWALARDKAKEIIDFSPNSLNTVGNANTPAFGMAWDDTNPFTKESMLELSYIQVQGLGNWLTRETNGNAGANGYWGPNLNATPLVSEGWPGNLRKETAANPNGLFFPGALPNQGLYMVTPDLYDAFEVGDNRRDFSIMTRYNSPSGKPYLCQPTFRKFIDISFYLGEENTDFRYTNSNVILYRYADALLIYAEAQNEADGAPNTEAYDAINELRDRAGLGDLSGLSQDDFRKAVWQERRVELHAENKRRFDLIRTNRLVTETTTINLDWTAAQGSLSDYRNAYTPFYNDRPQWPENEWLWPIPQSQMDLNLSNGWKQNKGYVD